MANTSSHMLRLLSLLQTHRYWPGAELASRLDVSERTLRRDVERLRQLGYPVDAQRGIDGGYQLAAGTNLPPLVLDDEEAVALTIGLRAAAQGAVAGIEESSVRALAKMVQIMPPHLRRRVDALRSATVPAVWSSVGPTVDAGVLTAIAQACRDEERMRFSYTAGDGESSSRHVEPHWLVSLGRRWYLVAYDLRREDWRTFRLDRIDGARATGMRFHPRALPGEDQDPAAYVRKSIGNVAAPQWSIEAIIRGPAETVRASLGQWATVESLDANRCRLTMTLQDLSWAAMALGSVRSEFEVVRPPELIDYLKEWSARFSRAVAQ
jgi:predicted DNA-binding transcriptional regulator YafY